MHRLVRLGAAATLMALAACSNVHPVSEAVSLSGTISGLGASGLVLANGTSTVAVASGATNFNFGNVLLPGSPYAITVQTQPAGQTCSVANGSGTTGTADVANVVVTCAAQGYQLGGTVSGLITSGLVLANGSNTVTVLANATTFALPALVAPGSSYNVTVQTQPTGEACSIAGGSATMPAGAVTSVAVTCTDQPFTLGGTITGLSTAGLVIANGTDTVTVPADASTFKLPTAVDFGSAYALTVTTQPTGLTCSFSSGANLTPSSGTMPASNVTNLALVCSPQAYALGGNVTGLVGSVVLTDGTNSVTVSASGSQSFTLSNSVAYGTQYAVTVQTQPAGVTCTPGSNSTGTMPASPVSVTVTCSVNTYTLGGSISGLTGAGLVLANGSGNTVGPAAGAIQFTLPNGIAVGSTYSVTATTQPVGQDCVTASNTGTMPASNVTSVQVTCYANTFAAAGGPYTWTVPAGVTSLQIIAIGGGGGSGSSGGSTPVGVSSGGNGALVTSTISVQPGDSLTIYVGDGGQTYTEGGGGGGLTYVSHGSTFLIAGGGGGAGGGPGPGQVTGGPNGNGGNGGSAGGDGATPGSGGAAGNNGAGGAAGVGGTEPFGNTSGSPFTDIVTNGSGSGGTGGGNSQGGAGGAGISATIGNGGYGGWIYGAGGGGGGYGGGGGGADGAQTLGGSAGGGGGGSTGPTGTTYTVAPANGPGAGGINGAVGTPGSVVIEIIQ